MTGMAHTITITDQYEGDQCSRRNLANARKINAQGRDGPLSQIETAPNRVGRDEASILLATEGVTKPTTGVNTTQSTLGCVPKTSIFSY